MAAEARCDFNNRFNLLPSKSLDGPLAWRIIALLNKRLQARRVVRNAEPAPLQGCLEP